MNDFFRISRKIPRSPLRSIVIVFAVVIGAICFRLLMDNGLLDAAKNRVLFLAVILAVLLIVCAAEYGYLKKMKQSLTKEELTLYLKVNYIIIFLIFIVFALILFIF